MFSPFLFLRGKISQSSPGTYAEVPKLPVEKPKTLLVQRWLWAMKQKNDPGISGHQPGLINGLTILRSLAA